MTPSPTVPPEVDLPPLDDFRGKVITSGEGGGPICDDFYQGPPSVHGATNLFVPARTGVDTRGYLLDVLRTKRRLLARTR